MQNPLATAAVVAIHSGQLNIGQGYATVSIVDPSGLSCQNPDRPAIVGDVLSVTPTGEFVARPAGTDGAWERCVVVGNSLVFAPNGPRGIAVMVPYASEIPNA